MATNGGKRPGAGRKPGQKNKATLEREAAVAASGTTPLDLMLKAMRSFEVLADRHANNAKKFEYYLTRATDVAYRVAAFVHPKIPAPAARAVFTLPAVKTTGDIVAAQEAITAAVAEGKLAPSEAVEVANILDLQRKAIRTNEHEARLAAIEAVMGRNDDGRL